MVNKTRGVVNGKAVLHSVSFIFHHLYFMIYICCIFELFGVRCLTYQQSLFFLKHQYKIILFTIQKYWIAGFDNWQTQMWMANEILICQKEEKGDTYRKTAAQQQESRRK